MQKLNTIQERAKDISAKDIERIQETELDLFSFVVTSQNPKNQGEVKYFVYKDRYDKWYCDCPSYIYSKDPINATCKHIIRVKEIYKID